MQARRIVTGRVAEKHLRPLLRQLGTRGEGYVDAPAPMMRRKLRLVTKKSRETPIARQSLHYQVADRLRDMIVHGDLAAGEKVRVAGLSESLGVSPTPIREALKVLAEDGLVELTPNRGARVAAYTPGEAIALFEVIAGLESLGAELACRRMSRDDLAGLEALHAQMRDQYESRRKNAYFEINNRIHEAIIAYSGNDVLVATHQRLLVRARRGRYLAIIDPDRWREAMDEHEAVMAAFRALDAVRAAAVWRQHLEHSGAALSEVLKRREAASAGKLR